jgi:capsular exopolysaccharide synthesis family protein
VVQIEKESSVVRLTVTGFVPEQEADYLNELMDVYINDGLEYKRKIAESTIAFINEQISKISDSLEFAATKLENFRMENSFISLSNEGTLIQNKLLENGTQKSLIELKLQYYDYLSEYLNDKNRGDSIISPSVLEITDQALLALVSELASLKKEKENLEFNLVINQQALVFNSRQIEITTEALKENVRNGIANLRLAKEEIEKRIALVGTEIKKLPSTERELIKIQRQFDLNNTVYTYLLEKRAEAGIVKASTLADNRTIDPAQYLGVGFIKPKTTANFLIALILGLMVPLLLIIAIDYFYDKVIDKKDIERKTKVPVIGYISHNESLNELAVVERPGSLLAESFRSVRTAIKYYVKENETTVIGVSSTITSEGKTFISINLAAIIAMVGKKVLLIGFDLRKPRINKVFGFDNSFSGMSTYLSSNCEYDEIIKATGIDNLYYAPSGPVPPNPAELIETEQMKKFMDRARNEFDYIIIDTPPVAIVTDTLLLGPYIDVNLFIVRQRYSSRSTLELIEQMNNQGLLKNMAIVMNDISLSGYYSYGMRYGYLRGYGFIYGNAYYGSKYYERLYKSDKTKGYYKDE